MGFFQVLLIHTAVSFASFFLITLVETRLNAALLGACPPGKMQDYPLHVLEEPAEARDHDTWNVRMEYALAPLKCHIIQSTSDEAPGLLTHVAQHLGAHHSPD